MFFKGVLTFFSLHQIKGTSELSTKVQIWLQTLKNIFKLLTECSTHCSVRTQLYFKRSNKSLLKDKSASRETVHQKSFQGKQLHLQKHVDCSKTKGVALLKCVMVIKYCVVG